MATKLRNLNMRICLTPTGQLRLGFVHALGPVESIRYGHKCRTWKSVSEKERAKLAAKIGAKLLKV